MVNVIYSLDCTDGIEVWLNFFHHLVVAERDVEVAANPSGERHIALLFVKDLAQTSLQAVLIVPSTQTAEEEEKEHKAASDCSE